MSDQQIAQLEIRRRERPDDPEAFLALARAYDAAKAIILICDNPRASK
jgi:cytochrome c-type biogenesis protein CcmH/NrfG